MKKLIAYSIEDWDNALHIRLLTDKSYIISITVYKGDHKALYGASHMHKSITIEKELVLHKNSIDDVIKKFGFKYL